MATFPALGQKPDFRTDPFVAPALTNALRFKSAFSSMSPSGTFGSPAKEASATGGGFGQTGKSQRLGTAPFSDTPGDAPSNLPVRELTPEETSNYGAALGSGSGSGHGIPSVTGEATSVTASTFSRKRRRF